MPLHPQLHHHQLLQLLLHPLVLHGVSGACACQPQRCLPLPLLPCQQEASPQPALRACATAAAQVHRLQLLLLPR
jgi:hypothetical protein